MRRAHDADPQRIRRHGVGAEPVAAGDLGHAVEPRDARADGRANWRRPDRGLRTGRHHRIDDLAVAGAAAKHAAQRVLDLPARRLAIAQHVLCRHQHAGRADAALRRAMFEERFLQRRQSAIRREALNRLDPSAGYLAHRDQARADLAPVEPHRAGAAVAGIAADLGAGEAEVVAQRRGEPRDRRAVPFGPSAVQGEGDLHAKLRSRRRIKVTTASRR